MSKTIDNLNFCIEFLHSLWPVPKPSVEQIQKSKIVSHRGWHNNINILENTIESFEFALRNHLDAIEFDIRWTKDLVPIVFHDADLTRLFGSDELICQLNFDQIRLRFPIIPTLSEVIDKFGGKIHLFIELKDKFYPNLTKQKEILIQILSPLKPEYDFHFLVQKKSQIQILSSYSKRSVIFVAILNIKEISQIVFEEGWGGMASQYLLMHQFLLKKLKTRNFIIGVGYPRFSNTFKREMNREVDWIFTNHPWKLLKIKSKLRY